MAAKSLLFSGFIIALVACGTPEAPKQQDPQTQRTFPSAASRAPSINAKVLFDRNCASCHGVKGRGDGPASAGMANKPADLASLLIRGKSNAELLGTITEGKPEKGMPPWKAILSQEEIRALVNYIRSLRKD